MTRTEFIKALVEERDKLTLTLAPVPVQKQKVKR